MKRKSYSQPAKTRTARKRSRRSTRTVNAKRKKYVKKEKRRTDDEAVCVPKYRKKMPLVTGRRAVVSRSFKNKVHTAMEKNMIRGRFMGISTQQIIYPQSANNSQIITYLNSYNAANRTIAHFDFAKILDAASVLWNDKTMALNPLITDAGNFSPRSCKIFCFDAKVVYQMKNNGQRRLHMRLYEVAPKADILAGDPVGIWDTTLTFQGPSNSGSNANGFSANALYASPTILPDWTKQYRSKVTKITLDPGQECEFVLQGPQNYMYDTAKAWNGETYYAQQKHSKFLFLVSNVDLVNVSSAAGTNLGAGRLITNDNKLGGLIVESVHKYHLGMPEQTGFQYPASTAAGVDQPANWRQYSYATNNFTEVPVGYDTVYRMDDEVVNLIDATT